MDPLSVAASIAGLLQAAAGVSSILSKISASRTSGFKEIKDVKTAVETLRSVLLQLQSLLLRNATIDHRRASLILVDEVVATLTGCVMTFSDLDGCVKGLESDEKLGILDRLRWASRVPELKNYLQNLEAHKSSLTLMLSILTCQSSQNAEEAASELKTLILCVLESNVDLARRMRLLEGPEAASTTSSQDDSVSISQDTIRGPSTLTDISDASGSASQHIRIVHAFEEDLQSSWVYQRSRTRGPDNFSISGMTQLSQSWSMLSGLSLFQVSCIAVQALPFTIGDLSNGELYTIVSEDGGRSEPVKSTANTRTDEDGSSSKHITNVQAQSRQQVKEAPRPYQVIGPYKFTHKDLVKNGVIRHSKVPEIRQKMIWFHFINPQPGGFLVKLYYKGRPRALIDIELELDVLIDMQKRNQEEIDIEYLQFNISKLLELFKKRFMSKKS